MFRLAQVCMLSASLCCSLPFLASAQATSAVPVAPPQIVVSASGEVRIQPDRATIMVSVETRGATAAAASAENAKRLRSVSEALRTKIGPSDLLSTVGYSVTSDDRFDAGQRKTVGYITRNTVVLETQTIDKVGSYIDVALSSGANLISGLRFWSSSIDKARREALAIAVASARADAESMAKAAGGSLGSLLELQATSTNGPIVMEAMAMRAVAETPILPSQQTVSASITGRWSYVSSKN